MLEIEKEEFENERRAKNQRIMALQNEASSLNEKLLILKMDFEEKETQGQEKEGRLKEELKNISEELVALQKKRNQIFIETLEEQSQIRRNSLLEHRQRKKSDKMSNNVSAGEKQRKKENLQMNGNHKKHPRNQQNPFIQITKVDQQGTMFESKQVEIEKSNCSIEREMDEDKLTVKRVGFGSTEKFEDKIDSYNREIYRRNIQKYLYLWRKGNLVEIDSWFEAHI